jgi:transcriptional regulator with XRE-family HTH domain
MSIYILLDFGNKFLYTSTHIKKLILLNGEEVMTTGQRLKELRELLGLKKAQIARELGIPYTTYNNYEAEACDVNSDVLRAVSVFYGVPTDYLLGLKPNAIVELQLLNISETSNEQVGKVHYIDLDDVPPIDEIPDDILISEINEYLVENVHIIRDSKEQELIDLYRNCSLERKSELIDHARIHSKNSPKKDDGQNQERGNDPPLYISSGAS